MLNAKTNWKYKMFVQSIYSLLILDARCLYFYCVHCARSIYSLKYVPLAFIKPERSLFGIFDLFASNYRSNILDWYFPGEYPFELALWYEIRTSCIPKEYMGIRNKICKINGDAWLSHIESKQLASILDSYPRNMVSFGSNTTPYYGTR